MGHHHRKIDRKNKRDKKLSNMQDKFAENSNSHSSSDEDDDQKPDLNIGTSNIIESSNSSFTKNNKYFNLFTSSSKEKKISKKIKSSNFLIFTPTFFKTIIFSLVFFLVVILSAVKGDFDRLKHDHLLFTLMNIIFKRYSMLIFLSTHIFIQLSCWIVVKYLNNDSTRSNKKKGKNTKTCDHLNFFWLFAKPILAILYWILMTKSIYFVESSITDLIQKYFGFCIHAESGKIQHFSFLQNPPSSASSICQDGAIWVPFDLSGHVLICTISILFLSSEMYYLYLHSNGKKSSQKSKTVFQICCFFVVPVIFYFCFMICRTSIRFHMFIDKIIGLFFGSLLWICCYVLVESHHKFVKFSSKGKKFSIR